MILLDYYKVNLNQNMKLSINSLEKLKTFREVPFYSQPVTAGFPSPADDFLEFDLSLDRKLIKHPSATFFVSVNGNSMENAKIFNGSILLVDRAEKICNRDVVLAVVDGDFTVKRYRKIGDRVFLYPENCSMKPIEIVEGSECYVWGKVMWSFNKIK